MKRPLCALAGALILSLSPFASAEDGEEGPPPGVPFARTEVRVGSDSFVGRAEASSDGWSRTHSWGRPGGWGNAQASVRAPNGDSAWSNSFSAKGTDGATNAAFSLTKAGDRTTISRSYASPYGSDSSAWTISFPDRGGVNSALQAGRSRFAR